MDPIACRAPAARLVGATEARRATEAARRRFWAIGRKTLGDFKFGLRIEWECVWTSPATLGFAYVVSILASLGVAVTVTPVLCSFLLPRAGVLDRQRESWLVEHLKGVYARTLAVVLRHPMVVAIAAVLLVVVTIAIFPLLGRGFLPEFQEGTLTVSAVTVPGTGIVESDELGRLVERKMLAHPAVASTARRTGRAEFDEHAQGANAAEIEVILISDLSQAELGDVMDELRVDLAAVPGTNITMGQPIGHRIDHMLSGTRAAIAVKIFGPDLHELRRIAEAIRAAVEDVPGVVDLAVEQQADVPQLRIAAKRDAMSKYGCDAGDSCRGHRCGLLWRARLSGARRTKRLRPRCPLR